MVFGGAGRNDTETLQEHWSFPGWTLELEMESYGYRFVQNSFVKLSYKKSSVNSARLALRTLLL